MPSIDCVSFLLYIQILLPHAFQLQRSFQVRFSDHFLISTSLTLAQLWSEAYRMVTALGIIKRQLRL